MLDLLGKQSSEGTIGSSTTPVDVILRVFQQDLDKITTDEAPDESQALLFYTRQAELARAQTWYGTTTKARSAR